MKATEDANMEVKLSEVRQPPPSVLAGKMLGFLSFARLYLSSTHYWSVLLLHTPTTTSQEAGRLCYDTNDLIRSRKNVIAHLSTCNKRAFTTIDRPLNQNQKNTFSFPRLNL